MLADRLFQVQRHMAAMGWKGEPSTGFTHKEDADGVCIARRHDETWFADFGKADRKAARLDVVEEIESRAAGDK